MAYSKLLRDNEQSLNQNACKTKLLFKCLRPETTFLSIEMYQGLKRNEHIIINLTKNKLIKIIYAFENLTDILELE